MKKGQVSQHSRISIVISVLLLIAAAVLSFAARKIPGFAESYSTAVYPLLQAAWGHLTGWFTFSLSEMICLILPVCIIADIMIQIRKRDRVRPAAVLFRHLFLLVSLIAFLYSANCGVNYYRNTFVPQEVYDSAAFTKEDLISFCEYTAEQLNKSSEYYEGVSDIYPAKRELGNTAISSMEALSREYPELSGYYPLPKHLTVLSRLFSSMGVSGIYSPFTIEANINGEMPGPEKPFTACHELSHLRGYMNEGEANYIGWLACIGSEDKAFNRSGWIIAWIYAGSALNRTDPDAFSGIYKKLPDDVISELKENHEFWASHETKASEIQDQVNDVYLKSNGLQDGIASYDRLTTLMLVWFTS